MKNILISVCLGLSLAACASAQSEAPVVNQPVWDPPVAPVTNNVPVFSEQTITGDTWSFSVPGNWNKVVMEDSPTIKASYGNQDIKSLFVLSKESFDGNMDDFVQITAASITHQGGVLLGSRKVSIHNHDFYLLNGTKGGASIWSWVTVTHGVAYGLICGGPTSMPVAEESCDSIANSFQIK